jgi:four helix bundle protein
MNSSSTQLDIKYRTYNFTLATIKYLDKIEVKKIFNSLINQVIRSSTSIGANVVEGKSGSSKKDLINYFKIALKSANETKYWLCLLRDAFNLEKKEINLLIQEADEISRILAASLLTLQGKQRKSVSNSVLNFLA